jgi:hypothetical protein
MATLPVPTDKDILSDVVLSNSVSRQVYYRNENE